MRAEIFSHSKVTLLIEVLLTHNHVRRNSSKASVWIERSGLNMFSIKSLQKWLRHVVPLQEECFFYFFMNEESTPLHSK